MTRRDYTKRSEFFAKYRHPNWQKKRLEVMSEAGFVGAQCGNKDVTLNVHHKFYVRGRSPWEYDNKDLECLCETCHEARHKKDEQKEKGKPLDYETGKALLAKMKAHFKSAGGERNA